jgi:hypothetical protein
VAEEDFRAFIQHDQAASKSFEELYASRLELRALTCTQGLTIGRFTTIATIKSLPLSRNCFTTQDMELQQYLGIRQIAVRLSQPPLKPLLPLGPFAILQTGYGPQSYNDISATASGAGIAVLQGSLGKFISIEIPGGKKIADLPTITDAFGQFSLSPNGRVIAIKTRSSGVLFFDTETGAKLWDAKEINQFFAWLPEISVALVNNTQLGTLSYIDFNTGKIEPHTFNLRNQSWALSTSTSPSRVLVGTANVFSLIEHERTTEGIKGTIIKEFHTKQGHGVTSSTPTLMLGGKAIVFISSRDFMAIDLETGKETFWPTGEFLLNKYGKLSETKLMVDSHEVSGVGFKPWVFDIEQSTLSPVKSQEVYLGPVSELVGRTGFMRMEGGTNMWLGDEIIAGDPQPLATLLSTYNVERQIARLEAMTQANGVDSLRIRQNMGLPATITAPSPVVSPIADLVKDAQVEAVGVYQGGKGDSRTTPDGRKIGPVEVRIRRSAKPVVLILSSYEPVRWMLKLDSGAKLAAVLVSGYYPSEVDGAGATRIVMIGGTYAYKLDSPQYNALNREIIRWVGKSIGVFQGRYDGGSFSVGQ